MSPKGGAISNQNACYSGQKRHHCSRYLTVASRVNLTIYLHGSDAGQ